MQDTFDDAHVANSWRASDRRKFSPANTRRIACLIAPAAHDRLSSFSARRWLGRLRACAVRSFSGRSDGLRVGAVFYGFGHECPANAWSGLGNQLKDGPLGRLFACRDLNGGKCTMRHEPWPHGVRNLFPTCPTASFAAAWPVPWRPPASRLLLLGPVSCAWPSLNSRTARGCVISKRARNAARFRNCFSILRWSDSCIGSPESPYSDRFVLKVPCCRTPVFRSRQIPLGR